MQSKIWIVPAIGLVVGLSSPVLGQDVVEQDAEIQTQTELPPPAPPPTVLIPPPAPPRTLRPQRARPVNSIRPKPTDYPVEAWRADEQGAVQYKVDVSATGEPVNCQIVDSVGMEALEKATCKLVMDARFTPATNAERKPFASEYSSSIFWRKSEPVYPGSMIVHVSAVVDPEKELPNCEVIEISGKLPNSMLREITNSACPLIRAERAGVYRDEDGNPKRAKVTVKLVVTVEDVPE
ncbi:MAG: energy transducer TonB [Erythrobacter sp.]